MLKLPGSTILLAMHAVPAVAQTSIPARTDENAVRQAEDAGRPRQAPPDRRPALGTTSTSGELRATRLVA